MKIQKTNWLVYLILGALSVGIISASFLFKNRTEWFTIISGIGCGAFASVLIAYLIEFANVTQKMRKNISIFESYFGKLYFSFSQLLSSFVIVCDKEKRENVGNLSWFNWLERLAEEQIAHTVPSAKNFLIDKLKDTQQELAKIEDSKLLLLGQDLIEDTEIIALTEIKLDLSMIECELTVSETNWANIKLIIPELKEHIEKSEVLKKYNNTLYKDDLLKLIFTRCYLNR